jgi:hypothetical protein
MEELERARRAEIEARRVAAEREEAEWQRERERRRAQVMAEMAAMDAAAVDAGNSGGGNPGGAGSAGGAGTRRANVAWSSEVRGDDGSSGGSGARSGRGRGSRADAAGGDAAAAAAGTSRVAAAADGPDASGATSTTLVLSDDAERRRRRRSESRSEDGSDKSDAADGDSDMERQFSSTFGGTNADVSRGGNDGLRATVTAERSRLHRLKAAIHDQKKHLRKRAALLDQARADWKRDNKALEKIERRGKMRFGAGWLVFLVFWFCFVVLVFFFFFSLRFILAHWCCFYIFPFEKNPNICSSRAASAARARRRILNAIKESISTQTQSLRQEMDSLKRQQAQMDRIERNLGVLLARIAENEESFMCSPSPSPSEASSSSSHVECRTSYFGRRGWFGLFLLVIYCPPSYHLTYILSV